ncbi:hypothetical protein [Nonomuraea cavernae]|uniref:hypothetical protein n=1 Tax=Nonomuraea cavernae TaxID=2045107 RepID=UPI0033C74BD0
MTTQDLTEGRQPSETEPVPPPPPTDTQITAVPPAKEPSATEPPAETDAAKTQRPAGTDAAETDRPTEPVPDEDEDRPVAAGGEAGRRPRVTRARVMGALAAMLVAALAATAVLQWVSANQAHDALARLETERALRLEVSGAAASFGQSLLSYDYQDLQTTRSTLMAQATGDFLTTYDEAFGGAMAQVIVKLKAVSRATVREVYLSDVDEATAHAIVVVDQQVNTAEAIRSVTGSHLKVTLVKAKGVWKVQEVTVLGAAKEDQYNLDGTPADDAKKAGDTTKKD